MAEVFQRYEEKYLISAPQYAVLFEALAPYMTVDAYGKTAIGSLYFDTPDFYLIRTSLEKPVYKEKLRLRSYGRPGPDSPAFVELKKKYEGIVYKRRISLPYQQALRQLQQGYLAEEGQIAEEINWCLSYYETLAPAAALFYERLALYCVYDQAIRITFDENIRYRFSALDLALGDSGTPLLAPGMRLMELKFPGSMPLWLSRVLNEAEVFPASFSKYGTAYLQRCGKKGESKSA